MALADHKHDSNITLGHLLSKMSLFRSHRENKLHIQKGKSKYLSFYFSSVWKLMKTGSVSRLLFPHICKHHLFALHSIKS